MLIITNPEEVKLIFRWRAYQYWVRSLPPGLLKPLKSEPNLDCTALERKTVTILRNNPIGDER